MPKSIKVQKVRTFHFFALLRPGAPGPENPSVARRNHGPAGAKMGQKCKRCKKVHFSLFSHFCPPGAPRILTFPRGKVNILAGGGRGALLGQNDKILHFGRKMRPCTHRLTPRLPFAGSRATPRVPFDEGGGGVGGASRPQTP